MIWLLACSEPEPVQRPDLVLISIETLRADHLPAWGYHRETMPWLSSVEGRRFATARSSAPWTLPSMASMLTGLQAAEHGVQTHDDALSEGVLTLAEELREAGYETAFFGVNELFVDGRGLDQGFETFEGVNGWSGDRLLRSVRPFLADRDPTRPLLLVVHLFEPHCPYQAPRDLLGTVPPEPGTRLSDAQWEALSDCYRHDRDLGRTLAAYDEELLAVDRLISRIEWPGTLVVVGDHGEAFWEHGDFGHGRQVYAESVHVPLIVRGPGMSGVEERPVSTAWIANTFRELAGLEPRGPTLTAPGPQVVSATRNEGLDRKVVAEGSLRLFVTEEGVRLTDVASDPAETGSLEDPEAVARLLAALPAAAHEPVSRPLGEAAWERLRALGYTD